MSESTLSIEADLQQMLDLDEPSNTIIESDPGIGTFALLTERLAAAGANVFVVDGRQSSALSVRLPDSTYKVEPQLLAADTLVVPEAAAMDGNLSWMISMLVQEREIHGDILDGLKRVILLYPDLGEVEGREFFLEMGTNYTPVRITRTAPGISANLNLRAFLYGKPMNNRPAVDTMREVLRDAQHEDSTHRRNAEQSAFAQRSAQIASALDIMLWAEKDWENLPPSLLGLDEPARQWIAAALASEGIGKVS